VVRAVLFPYWSAYSNESSLFSRKAVLIISSKSRYHDFVKHFNEGELQPWTTVKKYLTVQIEGKRQVQRQMEYYDFDKIVSVDKPSNVVLNVVKNVVLNKAQGYL
jgi:hypothetical protein